MKEILIILLLFLNLNPTIAEADLMMFHFRDSSCGAWMKSASNPEDREVYEFWFRGFVSGYNFGNDQYEVMNGMPTNETLAVYIDKYCRENPLNPFTSAALNLVRELKVKK